MITEEELQDCERYGCESRCDRLIAEVRRLNAELDLAARGVITHAIVRSARRAERERCARILDERAVWHGPTSMVAEAARQDAAAIRALPEEG